MVERSRRCVVDVARVITPLSQSRWGGAGLAQVRCAVNRRGLLRRKIGLCVFTEQLNIALTELVLGFFQDGGDVPPGWRGVWMTTRVV